MSDLGSTDPRIRQWLSLDAPRTAPRAILARTMLELDQDPHQDAAYGSTVARTAAFLSVAAVVVVLAVLVALQVAGGPGRHPAPGAGSASPAPSAAATPAASPGGAATYRYTDPIGDVVAGGPDIETVTAQVTGDGLLRISLELVSDWPAALSPLDSYPLLTFLVPNPGTYQHEVFNGHPVTAQCDVYLTGYGIDIDAQGGAILSHHEHTDAFDNGASFRTPIKSIRNGRTLTLEIPLRALGDPVAVGFRFQLSASNDRFPDGSETCQTVPIRTAQD